MEAVNFEKTSPACWSLLIWTVSYTAVLCITYCIMILRITQTRLYTEHSHRIKYIIMQAQILQTSIEYNSFDSDMNFCSFSFSEKDSSPFRNIQIHFISIVYSTISLSKKKKRMNNSWIFMNRDHLFETFSCHKYKERFFF